MWPSVIGDTGTFVKALKVLMPSSRARSMSSIRLSVEPRMMMVEMALSSDSTSNQRVHS